MVISDLRKRHIQEIAKRDALRNHLAETKSHLATEEIYLENCQKARAIVQIVAEQTQKKIEFHISNLVSMALASVFPDPYEFALRFVQRRNKTEADLIFMKNGNEGDPIDISGGGALDVASFALRVAIWSIRPTRNTLMLDEPFKFVSRDLQPKCSNMIKYLSEKLKIQLIIVSHIPEIIDRADKIFEAEIKNKETHVTTSYG
jgi:DNA repair exonuclease SbcCD ATPase subunit